MLAVANEDALVRSLLGAWYANLASSSVADVFGSQRWNPKSLHLIAVVAVRDDLELVGVVPVQEGDGDPHDAVEIARNRVGEGNLQRVKVAVCLVADPSHLLVLAELNVVRNGHEGQFLVSATMV